MKAITAKPETIRSIFTRRYIIPNFQRPYSWDKEQCEKLWDDIINFFEENENSKEQQYFLGNVVVNPSKEDNTRLEVIDGQQRLTTLLLLIKALHVQAGTVKALEECLRNKDPLTSELTDEVRIESHVISEDKKNLQAIVLQTVTPSDSKLLINFDYFSSKIEEWRGVSNNDTAKFESLIVMLLDNVVLLPIHCDSLDDSLVIFETINNRGMSLSDADIFKALLYKNTTEKKQDEFINDWNSLDDHDWLFRILMHVLRAKEGNTGKEISLRSYLTSNEKKYFNKPENIIKCLKIFNAINTWDGDAEINSLWNILSTCPNYYWNFPLFVFLHKFGNYDAQTDTFSLDEKTREQFLLLLHSTLHFFFIKGVVYNTVNAVKDTVYKVCAGIEKNDQFTKIYSANIQKEDIESFKEHLEKNDFGRFLRGMVRLSAYCNPKQNVEDFAECICGNNDIEHILPKKWNNYDGWTDELWEEQINLLGNLVPIARKQNIAAKNEFFARKQAIYKKSLIQDVKDLVALSDWTPEEIELKQKEKIDRLYTFFKLK